MLFAARHLGGGGEAFRAEVAGETRALQHVSFVIHDTCSTCVACSCKCRRVCNGAKATCVLCMSLVAHDACSACYLGQVEGLADLASSMRRRRLQQKQKQQQQGVQGKGPKDHVLEGSKGVWLDVGVGRSVEVAADHEERI